MSLRCLIGLHAPGGLVARDNRLAVKCCRCNRISPGIVIDGVPPHVTQPIHPVPEIHTSRLWWLRAVYETNKGA
jgi:hypothetical protein